ncbi:unnamed protein product [Sphenostylis stenocarpa]|uniref:Anaphase-promoting complex subunit 11 RING-H2 finger domain-containing protein n=1 Tax=Sphenostylis stenocarpa TaxID=92480 RepID=A0AA86W497_9FABA|nr:unnamed protein product [Sphenostylis stenocarpa]
MREVEMQLRLKCLDLLYGCVECGKLILAYFCAVKGFAVVCLDEGGLDKINPRVTLFPFVKYRWHAVAWWTWDAQDETCGICRMAFDGCCPDCKLPGDDCPLSKLLIILYADFHRYNNLYLGCMQSCISFALHPEMGEFSDITSSLPHMPSGVAV